ncbi:hypothetical protein BU26DRAFT_520343 [Trematosphaeria pertusa]|uniref:Uncharacterized protein n=1 Tax=Trematosphaeria pertusa TaxID=390896 RepID=A0A6A6IAX4_9PLEO|nr:uncharacterized protein BU26DRAFT_520343 [Trematosphaeria pertusa]KAF2247072.1 hypothetical protein BU26DRAFT_520343 [Trematosphaeria pertusa]
MAAAASPLASAYLLFISILFYLPSGLAQSPTEPSSAAPSAFSQPILHPNRTDDVVPGTIFTIRWTPVPDFQNVTLQLWDKTPWGISHDLLTPCFPWGRNPFCGTIAFHAPNTGSFDWQIPNPASGEAGSGFPRGEKVFWIKIYVEDYMHPEIGNRDPVVSYGQNFEFAPADGQQEPAVAQSDSYIGGMPTPTGDGAPGTVVTVTVYESPNPYASPTSPLPPASATSGMATAAPLTPGAASRVKGSIASALLLLLGFL